MCTPKLLAYHRRQGRYASKPALEHFLNEKDGSREKLKESGLPSRHSVAPTPLGGSLTTVEREMIDVLRDQHMREMSKAIGSRVTMLRFASKGVEQLGMIITLVRIVSTRRCSEPADRCSGPGDRQRTLISASDRAFDIDAILIHIQTMGAEAVIPPKCDHKVKRPYDRELYTNDTGSSAASTASNTAVDRPPATANP